MNRATKDINLEGDSIGRLLFKLASPAIIAQVVNILYNIIDRIYIGKMSDGKIAMAAIGVTLPIIVIITAFSSLIGMGGAPIAAIKMGEKNNDSAEETLSNSFTILLITGIILTIIFSIYKEPLLRSFGASEVTIGYAKSYLAIYVLGTVAVELSLGMNLFINTQGFAKISMMTTVIGAIINIVLDPILIFGFKMGVKGAALATIFSQTVSAVWVLYFLFSKKSIIKIRKKYLIPNKKIALSIISLGISPFIMRSTESLVLISLNNQLLKYGGDLAVAAMAIMSSIMQIIWSPLTGLAQGAQPIISYNYGAKNIERVKKTFILLLKSCLIYSTSMWSIIMIFSKGLVMIFNSDPELVKVTSWSMKIFFGGVIIFGAQIACQRTFLALGQAKISILLALLRKIVLLIPLVYIFPMFFNNKLMGVLMAEPVADTLAATSTTICFIIFFKKRLRQYIR